MTDCGWDLRNKIIDRMTLVKDSVGWTLAFYFVAAVVGFGALFAGTQIYTVLGVPGETTDVGVNDSECSGMIECMEQSSQRTMDIYNQMNQSSFQQGDARCSGMIECLEQSSQRVMDAYNRTDQGSVAGETRNEFASVSVMSG